jgi:hypothetical protein
MTHALTAGQKRESMIASLRILPSIYRQRRRGSIARSIRTVKTHLRGRGFGNPLSRNGCMQQNAAQ